MRRIVSLVYSSSKNNFEAKVTFEGKTIQVSQFGVDFDSDLMEELLKKFDGQCDVIAVSGFHPPVAIGKKIYQHPESQRLLAIPKQTPVVTGYAFKHTFLPWAVRNHVSTRGENVFKNRRVAFLSGLVQQQLVVAMGEFTNKLLFADPYLHFRTPIVLKGYKNLLKYGKRVMPLLQRASLKGERHQIDWSPWIKLPKFREFLDADIFSATSTLLERFDLSIFKGKTVMVDVLPETLEKELEKVGVKEILHFLPDLEATQQEPRLNYSVLEALIQCSKEGQEPVNQDDVLKVITQHKLKASMRSVSQIEIKSGPKFAFIIHPLSTSDFFRHPLIRPLERFAKPTERVLEKGLSLLNGIKYGRITGIRSDATGVSTEGIIYSMFETPRQMLSMEPTAVYDKLVAIAEDAANEGASIIGLGAFTKVVGDAGVSVAARSPIPVTTGNSLSAAATLWAANVVEAKLGFMPPFKKGQRVRGSAMVVGATGSIGGVSAKLLSKVASRLIITGPRPDRLLETKAEIEEISPETEVVIATNSNRYSSECDLIVLSTSSLEGDVLDIMALKPGCVVCDVSRPLSISAKQTIRRPDVLVIESGELLLPGHVELSCDIGLHDEEVYACLAETALLALEGRLENFTLSKNISYKKVNDIYDIAKKHGAKLASIRGPNGIITDQEIELCREHAQKMKMLKRV